MCCCTSSRPAVGRKNIDMARPLSDAAKQRLANRREDRATIDNGATYTQLRFLARAYSATQDDRVRDAFNKGLDYLLAAQYDNGGWPMFLRRARATTRTSISTTIPVAA